MKFIDVIIVNATDFKKAVETLEAAGIKVSVPVARKAFWE